MTTTRITIEQVDEARDRTTKELHEQGLDVGITDVGVLGPLARSLNDLLDDEDAAAA